MTRHKHSNRRHSRRHKGGRNSFDTGSYKSAYSNSFDTGSYKSAHSSPIKSPPSRRSSFNFEEEDPLETLGLNNEINKAYEEKTMLDAANFINKENRKEENKDKWYHRFNPFRSRATKKKEKQIQQFYAKDGTFEDEDEANEDVDKYLKEIPPQAPSSKKQWWKFWRKNTDKINAPATTKRRKFWPWRGGSKKRHSRRTHRHTRTRTYRHARK